MPGLCLSRRPGESVVIADGEIVVTVVEIRGDKVKLAFEAAVDIPINRAEIHEAIAGEKIAVDRSRKPTKWR